MKKFLDGIKLYKENNVDLILAIGGGSVIDCCKVICSGTEINEDIWEAQLEKGVIPENMGNFCCHFNFIRSRSGDGLFRSSNI